MSESLIIKIIFLSFSLINSLSLVLRGKKGQFNNYYLGWSLLFYSLFFLVFVLWYEAGLIMNYPFLMKTGSPLLFLTGPLFYFFVRSNTLGINSLKTNDYIHFLPSLLQILDLTPFYFLPLEQKRIMARQLIEEPYELDILARGILHPPFVHGIGLLLIFGYFFYSLYLILKTKDLPNVTLGMRWNKSWIFVALALMGLINLSYMIFRLTFWVAWFNNVELDQIQNIASYLILISITGLSFYIQLNPERIFGFELATRESVGDTNPHNEQAKNSESGTSLLPIDSMKDLDEKVKDQILELFEVKEIFKTEGLMVNDLAKILKISVRDLPQYFKFYFDSDFKSFVNDYRVRKAKEMIEIGYLSSFTLESLGKSCGFSSRTTFFNAFKKRYGKSPNEYWREFLED